MATTSRPISELVAGIRDTSGNVVASGKVRFYQPGTLVTQTVYSDAACTTPITHPYTLNAAGQGTVYPLEPVRMIVKDSTESVTYYDDIVNLNRHDAVYVTSPGFNGGAETTLEAVLAALNSSFGAGTQVKESSGATARNINTVLYERVISVKDYGAVGDGITPDHVAIQAASDRIEALGGGIVFFPKGTYLINATLAVDTAGVSWLGAGRGVSTIKNAQTAASAITVNLGGTADSKLFIRDLSITASTTSSGSGISVTNGDRVVIENVSVALHRTGIDTSAATSPRLQRIVIESTDDNAAGVGINLGTRARLRDSEVVCGTTNGIGIQFQGTDGRVTDCYVSKFATGISLAVARSMVRGCHVTTATTGVSVTGANGIVHDCYIVSATTGVSVGAVAGVVLEANLGASNTTDCSINSSATNIREFNNFSTYSNAGATPFTYPTRYQTTYTTSSSATPSWTPTHSPGVMQIFEATNTSGATVTVSNPTVTSAQPGDVIWLQLAKTGANNASFSMGNKFGNVLGGGSYTNAPAGPTSGQWVTLAYLWDGTNYREILRVVGRNL